MGIINVDDYQKKAHETADYPSAYIPTEFLAGVSLDWVYPVAGLSEEAGEVAGKFAKAVRDENGKISEKRKEEIVKELGDVCWFVAEICTVLHVDLSTVLQNNLEKLSSRKARGVIHGSGDNR